MRQLTCVSGDAMELSKQHQPPQCKVLVFVRPFVPRHRRCRVSLWHNVPVRCFR